ncbi:MAG: hypothetical protein WBP81_39020 [Solirubrobacteraceae bacterium]
MNAELVAAAVHGHQEGRDAALPTRLARATGAELSARISPASLGGHRPSEVVARAVRGTSWSIVAAGWFAATGHFAANREITRNM